MREQTGAQAGHKGGGGWMDGWMGERELRKGVVVKTQKKKKRDTSNQHPAGI